MFFKSCLESGRSEEIDEQICPKCGYDFQIHPRISPKCPYCEKELHLSDFFTTKLDKKDRKQVIGVKVETYSGSLKMWYCPFCGKILGFSDYAIKTL